MKRKIIEIDEEKCNGCGLCTLGCAEAALAIVNGKARLVKDIFCDGLGACLGHCPQDALHIIEREAAPFDEEAAMAHAHSTDTASKGCQGSATASFAPDSSPDVSLLPPISQLAHWPVKIRLAPANAPFFDNAHLLILGDCCAIASPNLHQCFLQGKVVLSGCPKFDDRLSYVQKLTAILQENRIASLTVLEMEVPCCSGMHKIVAQARSNATKTIPINRIILSRTGKITEESQIEESLDQPSTLPSFSGLQPLQSMTV